MVLRRHRNIAIHSVQHRRRDARRIEIVLEQPSFQLGRIARLRTNNKRLWSHKNEGRMETDIPTHQRLVGLDHNEKSYSFRFVRDTTRRNRDRSQQHDRFCRWKCQSHKANRHINHVLDFAKQTDSANM